MSKLPVISGKKCIKALEKIGFYFDTSVWGFLFEDEAIEKKKITEKLFVRMLSSTNSMGY